MTYRVKLAIASLILAICLGSWVQSHDDRATTARVELNEVRK